ncbi:hypothetical protein PIB30_081527, partial [Stylosanthes scabra]|nr:hypothetical protein [Stylosanthes scabra]
LVEAGVPPRLRCSSCLQQGGAFTVSTFIHMAPSHKSSSRKRRLPHMAPSHKSSSRKRRLPLQRLKGEALAVLPPPRWMRLPQ